MKNTALTAFLAATLALTSGITIAENRDNSSGASGDKATSEDKATNEGSSNKLMDQDLSDKDMKSSESGGDTKTIRMGFKRLDANDDSFITSDEASLQPPLNTQFKTVDKNSDQKLDMAEFASYMEANTKSINKDKE